MKEKRKTTLEVIPAFEHDSVSIVITPHKEYIPCMAVLIQSILENMNKSAYIDIIVICKEISEDEKNRLIGMVKLNKRVSLRFYDVTEYCVRYSIFKKHIKDGFFHLETYFRLLIPELMNKYYKTIYLDPDMIVIDDLQKLWDIDISKYMFAAVRDIAGNGAYAAPESDLRKYRDEVLRLRKPYDYFNAGMIVFNIAEINKSYTRNEWWKLAESKKWKYHDQDFLNYVARENLLVLPYKWNYTTCCSPLCEKYMREQDRAERIKWGQNPSIVHYVGSLKPWNSYQIPFFNVFWSYATRNPFFGDIFEMIGENRWIDNVVLQAKEGKVNLNAIKRIFVEWLKLQVKKWMPKMIKDV